MDVAECINGRGENHMVTHGPECFYCGQIPTKPFEPLRAALVAIQELHKPMKEWVSDREYLLFCAHDLAEYPCETRRLADESLNTN